MCYRAPSIDVGHTGRPKANGQWLKALSDFEKNCDINKIGINALVI
jgi:hypothetical protein